MSGPYVHFEIPGPPGLEEELRQVLNRHSAENQSGTPDWILANLLVDVLYSYNGAIKARSEWRGESLELPATQRLTEETST